MTIRVQFKETNLSFNCSFDGTTILHDGQNGATFFPAVSPDGILSWTNDRDLDNPSPVNIKGDKGDDGKDGYTPIKGVDYFDGQNGKDGVDGKTPVKGIDYFDGANGKDGYTPIKGEDYFTEADKQEMVNAVISALPKYNGEVVDV